MTAHDIPMTPEARAEIARIGAENMATLGLNPTTVEPWEDGYRTRDEATSFEWWYFDMQFEDGSNLVVTFSTKPHTHPEGPLQPEVLVIHRTAEGQSTKQTVEFPADQAVFDAQGCNVHIGPNWVKGDLAAYDMHVENDTISVDLRIDRVGPSWRPGAGYNYFNKEKSKYLAWVVPVPYGTVEASITPKGGEAVAVKGTAYHDHNWGNTPMGGQLDHWFWGRAHAGDYSLIYVQMTTLGVLGHLQYHLPVFYLAKGDEILTDEGMDLSLTISDEVDGPGGQTYPQKLVWEWNRNAENDPDGDPAEHGLVRFTVENPKLIEVLDMTDGMSEWHRRVVHLLGRKPLYYDFDAPLTLEVDLKGHKETVEGRTLFEKMMFR